MKILVEGYPYDRKDVECVLGESTRQLMDDKVKFEYVGYCFKPELGDCLFFLPKVVLQESNELVFGKCRPEDIIDLDAKTTHIDDNGREFLHELSMWIYQALVVYRDRNSNSEVLCERTLPRRGHSRKRRLGMLFDIMIALRDFALENRDFFLFQVKNRHRGMNRVDWRRTVAKTKAAITNGTPAYLAPVNRKREIDFDEELLVVFYSILGYIRDKYGFKAPVEFGYERIPKTRFEAYLKGYGRRRLLQIKYKYFSDRALMLWELCYAFFDHSEAHSLAGAKEEFLLAKDFNIVFEAIIDELLGDQDLPKAARELKEQRDGKIIDHLWLDRNLIQGHHDNVYYIGDSKYYKIGSGLGKESLHKQYTYARNIIQWNLGLFHGTEDEKKKKAEAGKYGEFSLRDDVTEGYNIVPNFFISANLDAENPARAVKEIKPLGEPEVSRQFENRLFDRDTLILSRYNVNFLFVLSLYARNNAAAKSQWREYVRKEFCDKVRHTLENLFEFYAIRPLPGTDPVRFLRENFQRVLGKVYSPWQSPGDAPIYSLALDRKFEEENTLLNKLLKQGFEVEKCPLGDDPTKTFSKMAISTGILASGYLPRYWLERYPEIYFLIGCWPDQTHYDWYFCRCKWKQSDLYNVRIGIRPGAVSIGAKNALAKAPRFLILYEEKNPANVRCFRLAGNRQHSQAQMVASGYPSPKGDYLCYELDEEVDFGGIDVARLLAERANENPATILPGQPLFEKGAEVIKYRFHPPTDELP